MSILARFTSATGPIAQGVENTDIIRDNQFLKPAFAATLNLVPTKSLTIVQPADLTGAVTINMAVGSAATAPFVADRLIAMFTSAPGAVITFGTGTLSAGTLIIPATKTANVTFVFYGAAWCESSRTITA